MSSASLVAASLALVAAACGQTATQEITAPDVSRCPVTVTLPPNPLPPEGWSSTLSVTTTRDCTWDAASGASWAQVQPASGQGAGSITVTVAGNDATQPRATDITVNEQRVRLNQAAAPCRFELRPRELQVSREGGRASVSIATTDGCEWRASSSAEWIRVITERGSGTAIIQLDVSRNDGIGRIGAITIADAAVQVEQEGDLAPQPGPPGGVPPPSSCTYAIDPPNASFRSTGGDGEIHVQTNPGCPWTASPGADWLSPTPPSGSGPATLRYRVAANLSTTSARSGTLGIAGLSHAVSQQACPLTIDPPGASFGSFGGAGSVSVVTESGCQWNATATADWISVQSSSGSGSGAVRYTVGVNSSATSSRSGSVSVSGRTHGVSQQPYRPEEISVEGTISDLGGSCPSLTFSVAGRTFVSDGQTDFRGGCGEVRSGVRAFVRGVILPDGRVRATLVDADD